MKAQQQKQRMRSDILESKMNLNGYSYLMNEEICNLMGTKLYNRKLKNLLNQLIVELEKNIISSIGNSTPEETEEFFKFGTMLEQFVICKRENGLSVTLAFLEQLNSGEVMVIDENKHSKIVKQLERV